MSSAPKHSAIRFAASRLANSLIAAAALPSRPWTPSLESAVRQFLAAPPPTPLTPALIAAAIDPHLLPHQSLAAGLFHWATHQPDFTHSPRSLHSYLRSLPAAKTLKFLDFAEKCKIRLLPSSTTLAARRLILIRQSLCAAQLLNQIQLDDSASGLLNALLAGLASEGHINDARHTFDQIIRRKIRFNDVGFGVFISWLSKSIGLEELMELVDLVKGLECGINGSVIAVLIVDGLCQDGKIDDGWSALDELRKRGWKPDFIAYRIVSEGFRSAGRLEECEKILKQKRKLGVAPRMDDYKGFLLSLISERRIWEVKNLSKAIMDGDFSIDTNVLDLLVRAVSDVDPDFGVLILKYMIRKGSFPNLDMLRQICRSLCKYNKQDKLLDVFRDLSVNEYFTGMEKYNVIIFYLCKAGSVREAYEVLKEMKKKGLGPDITCYNYLMEACCREDFLRPAKKLWDELFANGCCPNSQTYFILIRKFCETGEVDEAQFLFDHMLGKGLFPDSATLVSLINVLCREKRSGEALEAFRKSTKLDASLGGSTLSTLVTSLCKNGDFVAATNIMQCCTLHAKNFEQNSALVKSLAEAGQIPIAIQHLRWIEDNFASELQTILNHLVMSLSTAPKLDYVAKLLFAMHKQGILFGSAWLNFLKVYDSAT